MSMIVRSYSGRTVPEALEKVREDLGESALIIETRPLRESGLLGRRCGFEVVAASDPLAADTSAAEAVPQRERAPANQGAGLARMALSARQAETSKPTDDLDDPALGDELHAIRRQLQRLAAGTGTPTGHLGDELAARLEDHELPAETIAELDEALAQAGARLPDHHRHEFLTLLLARSLDCRGAIDWDACRQLMVVGPTGVGKTTTIAKLAGDLVLRRNRRVALVTIDTYRVGAAEQLHTYADLLDIPCEVARSPAELGRILERFADYDNVLIDSAGRSPADATRLHELRAFARATPGLQVMLAVGSTCGRAEFASVVERFSILPIEHVVATKLDECRAPGRLYGCLRRHRLPLRYCTTGQEVPDDILAAEARHLAEAVLGDCPADDAGTAA